MTKLLVTSLEVGSLATCCYIAHCQNKQEALIVDPGGDAEHIISELKKQNLNLKSILITHSHFDHVAALNKLHNTYPEVEIIAHSKCSERMQSPQANLSYLVGITVKTPPATHLVTDSEIIETASCKCQILFLPGHAPGHLVFYFSEHQILFCGDTLFNGSLGRTDFPDCSYKDLESGLQKKILVLADQIIVYPGHGPATTVGAEKKSNPFIKDML